MPAGQSGIATRAIGIDVGVRLVGVTSLRAVVPVARVRIAHRAARGQRKPVRMRLVADRINATGEEAPILAAKAIGTCLRPRHCPKSIASWFRMIGGWNRSRAKLK